MFVTPSSLSECARFTAAVSLGLFALDILAMIGFWRPLFRLGIRIFTETRAYPGLPRLSRAYPCTISTPDTIFRFLSNTECLARVKLEWRTETRSFFPIKCIIGFDGLTFRAQGRMSYFVPLFFVAILTFLLGPTLGGNPDGFVTIALFISPAVVIIMLTSSIIVERQRARNMLDELERVLDEAPRELQASSASR